MSVKLRSVLSVLSCAFLALPLSAFANSTSSTPSTTDGGGFETMGPFTVTQAEANAHGRSKTWGNTADTVKDKAKDKWDDECPGTETRREAVGEPTEQTTEHCIVVTQCYDLFGEVPNTAGAGNVRRAGSKTSYEVRMKAGESVCVEAKIGHTCEVSTKPLPKKDGDGGEGGENGDAKCSVDVEALSFGVSMLAELMVQTEGGTPAAASALSID